MSLTASHETYCQERSNGKSQYESLLIAYPHRKSWKRNSIDCAAAKLEKQAKIKQRIAELKKPQEDLLESNRQKLIDMGIKASLGQLTPREAKNYNPQVLNKMLDKLVATKSESKVEVKGVSLIDLIKANK